MLIGMLYNEADKVSGRLLVGRGLAVASTVEFPTNLDSIEVSSLEQVQPRCGRVRPAFVRRWANTTSVIAVFLPRETSTGPA
jgi:hypothetical protein